MTELSRKEALEIVLDLAEQNVIDDPDMQDETARQETAIEVVRKLMEDMADE